ncbi:DNA mismatch repair protein MutT, partial [Stenotrophomonas sp. 2YAF22]
MPDPALRPHDPPPAVQCRRHFRPRPYFQRARMSQRNTEAPRVVYEGKYQRMVVRGSWEYSERTHAGGLAAIIIAVTPEDNVLFVE